MILKFERNEIQPYTKFKRNEIHFIREKPRKLNSKIDDLDILILPNHCSK